MIKKPTALRASPSKDEVFKVFSRLLQQWPEDKLRPNRSIRNLKPITPANPAFDERHYYYQSAAMKYLLSDQYLIPQSHPAYYKRFYEKLEKEGLPRERGGMIRRFMDYLTGKEKSIN